MTAVLPLNLPESQKNWAIFREDLYRMGGYLRACGFPYANISTFYKEGSRKSTIRNYIRHLCSIGMDPDRDILFIYMTNHGVGRLGVPTAQTGLALWNP